MDADKLDHLIDSLLRALSPLAKSARKNRRKGAPHGNKHGPKGRSGGNSPTCGTITSGKPTGVLSTCDVLADSVGTLYAEPAQAVGVTRNCNRVAARNGVSNHPARRLNGPPRDMSSPAGCAAFVYAQQGSLRCLALRCYECNGIGIRPLFGVALEPCPACDGMGAYGLDPHLPTIVAQGSETKVAVMTARYQSGSPLWHPLDRIGHTKMEELNLREAKKEQHDRADDERHLRRPDDQGEDSGPVLDAEYELDPT